MYEQNLYAQKQLHSIADPTFFDDVTRWSAGRSFEADAAPAVADVLPPCGWDRRQRGAWTIVRPRGAELPEQGWKIHVSATRGNFDAICTAVWEYCTARGIAFKHLRDRNMLFVFNVKYAPRGSSGKALTVYPRDDAEFSAVLTGLVELLDGQEGPRILSDIRVRNGIVHARYGGFVRMDCQDGTGEWVHGIRRPDGSLVPDVRTPSFNVPDWVAMPPVLADHVPKRQRTEPESMPYRVQRALHFSNAGGVYVATRRSDGASVVLKEARELAGLDTNGDDAVARLDNEIRALERLRGIPGVPALYDSFTVADHHFLVEEYIDGRPLHMWCALNHPWVIDNEPSEEALADYTRRAVGIIDQVEALVRAMHDRGMVFGDLHIANVLVCSDDSVALVDYELAFDAADTDWLPGLAVAGFRDPRKRGFDLDLHGQAALRLTVFLLNGVAVDLDRAKAFQLADVIRTNFPVPQGWTDPIDAQLGASTGPRRPGDPGAPTDFSAAGADLAAVRASAARAVAFSATPERTDRLFPGDPQQFVSGGLDIANGAAGVLWALRISGHETDPVHEKWLVERARRTDDPRLGAFNGVCGVAYVLDELGYPDEARDLLQRRIRDVDGMTAASLGSGLAGVGATLLHMADGPGGAEYRERGLAITDRLAEAVRDGRFTAGGRTAAVQRVPSGLLHGWSGIALLLVHAYRRTEDGDLLDLAVRAVHRDLENCVETADGTLMYEEPGRRTMPYIDIGSAGIALAIDELLVYRYDEHLAGVLPALCRTSGRRGVFQAGLFRGKASQIATAARLSHRVAAQRLDRQLRDLSWYALDYQGHVAFPGTANVRLSMDLATGGAGVLLAMAAAERPGLAFLPFLTPRAEG